ncbi:Bacterial conjugation TrbI-like protein [Rivularia sp. PCC 7116]|uniref:TrbI/VirB10 family protein n=1 Tax=Rivularia sp. PCC 7116 TaxID=373994 RepID=UPI00029ECB37|nr:TrbI/VirB10 family protein [Rivularia sp. PCC 7116]AFY54277.1 Bacterial conjugation TrbI-like protein [Rivularia sp. PCC 7116]
MNEQPYQDNGIDKNENDSDWNEVSFGKLLGFKDENQPLNEEEKHEIKDSNSEEVNNQADATNPIATHELFDSPHEGKTQPNFYSNPFAKFGAVGLVMLVVFGSAATVLNSIMSGSLKTAPPTQYLSQSKPKVEIADDSNEREMGKLKAELALSTQAEKIKSVERAKSPKTAVSKPKPEVKPTLKPSIKTNIRPTPAREYSTPVTNQIVSRPPRPTRVPYIPRPKPQPLPVSYSLPRVPQIPKFQQKANRISKPTAPKLEEKIDPMEEWTKISRLGSYGSSVINANSDKQASESTIDNTIQEQPKQIIPSATLVKTADYTTQTSNNNELEPLHTEETAIIGYENNYQLQVGESVDGKLLTPLIWSKHQSKNSFQQSKNKSKSENFVIELEQPLNTRDGFAVLPKGSQVVAQINNVNQGGLIELQATQVVIDGKEYILPENAIAIRGDGGKPLVASRFNSKKGEIARRDAQTFAVGSLAKVGKVLNQPKEQQISTSSGFGGTNSFSSIRRGRENILGAVLEGGFEPLTQQILKRNQQALQELQRQGDIWYVKAGTEVQVFVNESFQF